MALEARENIQVRLTTNWLMIAWFGWLGEHHFAAILGPKRRWGRQRLEPDSTSTGGRALAASTPNRPIARLPSVRSYPLERRHSAGRGGRDLPRRVGGMRARARAAGLGVFAAWPGEHPGAPGGADTRPGPHGVGAGCHAGLGRGLSRAGQRLLAAERRAARRRDRSAPGGNAAAGAVSVRRGGLPWASCRRRPICGRLMSARQTVGCDRCDGFRRTDSINGASPPRRRGLSCAVASERRPGPREPRRQAGQGIAASLCTPP